MFDNKFSEDVNFHIDMFTSVDWHFQAV